MDKYSKELSLVNGFKDEIEKLSEDEIKKEISSFKAGLKEIETEKEIFEKLNEIAPRVLLLPARP